MKTLSIKWIKYNVDLPKFEDVSDNNKIIVLSQKIKTKLEKNNFGQNKIKNFITNYNKLLLAYKLYKESNNNENKESNKELVKKYINETINSLK